MSLPRFEYLTPGTLSEALSLAGDDAVFVAGGTDLFVRMKERLCAPRRVIGLTDIAALSGVSVSADGALCIGAGTTLTDLAEKASLNAILKNLREVILLTASPVLRNVGTVGGNLCQESRCYYYNQPPIFRKRWQPCLKFGGEICHVVKGSKTCHAVYSGDLAGPLVAMQAIANIAGPRGARKINIGGFFSGSGIRPNNLQPDEIMTDIIIPSLPQHGFFSYQKLRLRDTIDFPILGVSLFLDFDPQAEGDKCRDARLVLSATGPAPLLIHEVGEMLRGQVVTEEHAGEVGMVVRKMAEPVANAASSPNYRREMITVLTRRAIKSVLEQRAKASRMPREQQVNK